VPLRWRQEFLAAMPLKENQTQNQNKTMPNLASLNQTAQEIANALGTIDLDLLQKVHSLVTETAAADTLTLTQDSINNETSVS